MSKVIEIKKFGGETRKMRVSSRRAGEKLHDIPLGTSGTLIRGLSGPNLPSRFTPLKGSAVSSQQSAVNIDADGCLHLATLVAPYEQALRAAMIFVYTIGLHE